MLTNHQPTLNNSVCRVLQEGEFSENIFVDWLIEDPIETSEHVKSMMCRDYFDAWCLIT